MLKKSVYQNCLIIDWLERLFYTPLREFESGSPLPKVKISISGAYFSDAQTMADFFNRIDRELPAQFECNGSFCELPLILVTFFQLVLNEPHFCLDRSNGELLNRVFFGSGIH